MISKFPELINREDAKDAKKREGGNQCDRIAGRFRSASLTGRIRGFAATKEISPQRHEATKIHTGKNKLPFVIFHWSFVICIAHCGGRELFRRAPTISRARVTSGSTGLSSKARRNSRSPFSRSPERQ